MPVHPQCQPIANVIAGLETQRAAARAGLGGLSALARWQAFVLIGDLGRQILEQQALLDACQRQHQASYEADVVVLDTTNAPPASRTARLWSMDGAPTELESAALAGGVFGFATQATDAPVGITIEEVGNPAVQGVDFRSGVLDELPRNHPRTRRAASRSL
jgi:hypothetical protein